MPRLMIIAKVHLCTIKTSFYALQALITHLETERSNLVNWKEFKKSNQGSGTNHQICKKVI